LKENYINRKGGDKELCEEILFSIQLVAGLPEYYDSSDLICRQQIIGSIFLEKMVFQDGELRTKKVNEAVELLCRPGKGLKENANKKSSENSELSNVVPGTGIFRSWGSTIYRQCVSKLCREKKSVLESVLILSVFITFYLSEQI
jgi:hypothetical protein